MTSDASILNELRWLMRQVIPHRRLAASQVGLIGANTLLSSADPLVLRWLVDKGLSSSNVGGTAVAMFLLIGIYIARLALGYLSGVVGFWLMARVSIRLRRRMFRRVQERDLAFFDSHSAGDLLRTVEDDVDQSTRTGIETTPALFRVALTAFVTFSILCNLNWRLTLLAAPMVPLIALARWRFRSPLDRLADESRNALGQRSTVLTASLVNQGQVLAVGAGRFFRHLFARSVVTSARASLSQRQAELRFGIGSAAVVGAATLIVLWFGTIEVAAGGLTAGGFIAFYTLLSRLFEPALTSTELYTALRRAGAPIRRLMALENEQSGRATRSDVGREHNSESTLIDWSVLKLENVAAGYDEQVPVLRDVTLELFRGDFVAVVGASGSGKSTLLQVLLGLRRPLSGTYAVGSQRSQLPCRSAVNSGIAFSPARPFLVAGSLRENACLGDARVTEEMLWAAARVACFEGVVSRYPDGWDHPLQAEGAGLSDGERQRLGLVRALLHNKPVLLIDEGTGAIEETIEQLVLKRLRESRRQGITVMVTHRRGAAASADAIYRMHDGRLDRTELQTFDHEDRRNEGPRFDASNALQPESTSSSGAWPMIRGAHASSVA